MCAVDTFAKHGAAPAPRTGRAHVEAGAADTGETGKPGPAFVRES
jgi:hypothetical protein